MVRNVTDVDDSILPKARELGVPFLELAEAEIARFRSDMDALSMRPAVAEPRATESIDGMIEMSAKLMETGHAYEAHGTVYFDVVSFPRYGELSGYSRDDMIRLARERGGNPDDPHRRDPLDFVLWQPSLPDEPSWEAPFGTGRPGWHVECSVMSMHELHTTTLDLHGGGTDLIFPHHECEIAQSESYTHEPFSRYWVHSAMVRYDGEKMSKSLGNLVFVSDLLKVADPRAIRLALMRHQYRSGFEWHDTDLQEGTALLHRLLAAAERPDGADPRPFAERVRAAIDDDLDSPTALEALDDLASAVLSGGERHIGAGHAARARLAARHRPEPTGWNPVRAADRRRVLSCSMADITITLPDGSAREYPSGVTAGDVAASMGRGLAKAAVAAKVDGDWFDLTRPIDHDATVAIVTDNTEAGREVLRHSTAHVMAQAVTDLYPGAEYAIGPAIEDGFYYDFALPGDQHFSEDDLARIEDRMREIVNADEPFEREEVDRDTALAVFDHQPYKREIIERVDPEDSQEVGEGAVISLYRNPRPDGTEFVDLCRGPHVPTTKRLGAFKLTKVAGAYWRGNEKAPMLQRIYGTAWESKAALDDYLHRLEEAEKRDHRKLGVELDLFSFPEEIGSGLAIWHPKGGLVRKIMEDYSRARHEAAGYQFVNTPHITKEGLFQTSGHLEWFAEGMFPPMELDGGNYYLKPMNCPFHILIYKSRMRSYRELPHPILRVRLRLPLREVGCRARPHACARA